ncbi:MAG TPA: hypothetical protein VK587_04805 [bacterium]|nr:hypothetical protein [bacterium]
MRPTAWISRWIMVTAMALALAPAVPSFAGAVQTIGVPDFAARASIPNISGMCPGRFAADAATTALQRAAHPPLSVIPRTTMTKAQSALKWRDTDITKFAQLTALADRVGAAHLIIGTIDRLSVERVSNNVYRSAATVSIQFYTATPPRITPAVTGTGSGLTSISRGAAEQALRQAVEQALNAELAKIAPTR